MMSYLGITTFYLRVDKFEGRQISSVIYCLSEWELCVWKKANMCLSSHSWTIHEASKESERESVVFRITPNSGVF